MKAILYHMELILALFHPHIVIKVNTFANTSNYMSRLIPEMPCWDDSIIKSIVWGGEV
jgi:hypothetical protein